MWHLRCLHLPRPVGVMAAAADVARVALEVAAAPGATAQVRSSLRMCFSLDGKAD